MHTCGLADVRTKARLTLCSPSPAPCRVDGIPNMKLDKDTVARRIRLMEDEGVTFACGVEVGEVRVSEARTRRSSPVAAAASAHFATCACAPQDARHMLREFDSVVLATGSTVPNNLPIPGRELDGIVFAMEYLTQNQKRLFADPINKHSLVSKYDGSYIDASGQDVIVIGGGDTCVRASALCSPLARAPRTRAWSPDALSRPCASPRLTHLKL